MNFGVIVFPGANCDRDIAYVLRDLLNQPTRMVWHEDDDISDLDVIVVPGGFSYGDYLRCGAIAQFSPAMRATVEHANQGKLVMGICNGFQVLTEMGLLPGALVRNRDLHFVCDRTPLSVERTNLPWTQGYSHGQTITIPIAYSITLPNPVISTTTEYSGTLVATRVIPEPASLAILMIGGCGLLMRRSS